MNKTGIPILKSFEMIQDTLENEVYRKVLKKVTDSIVRGEEIASALGKSAYFDVLLIEMVSIGEKSGSLDQMLQSAAQYYDDEVSKTVGNLTSFNRTNSDSDFRNYDSDSGAGNIFADVGSDGCVLIFFK